jgi:hypothetical protein
MHHLRNSKCKRRLAQNLYLNSKGSQISSPLKLEKGAELSLSILKWQPCWDRAPLPPHLSLSQFSTPCPSAVVPLATLQKWEKKNRHTHTHTHTHSKLDTHKTMQDFFLEEILPKSEFQISKFKNQVILEFRGR